MGSAKRRSGPNSTILESPGQTWTAHRVADRFPDGQLHVNLRGCDPGALTTPADALGVLTIRSREEPQLAVATAGFLAR
jgi:hypothetical protein